MGQLRDVDMFAPGLDPVCGDHALHPRIAELDQDQAGDRGDQHNRRDHGEEDFQNRYPPRRAGRHDTCRLFATHRGFVELS
jgi:hypothetical protein